VAVPFTGFSAATSDTYTKAFDTDLGLHLGVLNSRRRHRRGCRGCTARGIKADQAYANIHGAQFPGGEIHGFITPEPSSIAMIALGLGGLLYRRFRP
jgi:hypothetical protein